MGPISYYMGPVLYFGNIFDGDHDNHHGYSMAITIHPCMWKWRWYIQTAEDGDGDIGDIMIFLIPTCEDDESSTSLTPESEGLGGSAPAKSRSLSIFLDAFHCCMILYCVPWWPNNRDMMLMMVQLQLWPRFSGDTYFCFCFPWVGLNMWGVGGYQNKLYTSVARESVRSSYKVRYVTLVCTFFW